MLPTWGQDKAWGEEPDPRRQLDAFCSRVGKKKKKELRGALQTAAVWDESRLTARQAEMASRMRRSSLFSPQCSPPCLAAPRTPTSPGETVAPRLSLVKIRKVGDGK